MQRVFLRSAQTVKLVHDHVGNEMLFNITNQLLHLRTVEGASAEPIVNIKRSVLAASKHRCGICLQAFFLHINGIAFFRLAIRRYTDVKCRFGGREALRIHSDHFRFSSHLALLHHKNNRL